MYEFFNLTLCYHVNNKYISMFDSNKYQGKKGGIETFRKMITPTPIITIGIQIGANSNKSPAQPVWPQGSLMSRPGKILASNRLLNI